MPCVTFTTVNNPGSEKTRVWHRIGPLLCRKQVLVPKFEPALSAKGLLELSFQQWHDIGNRSSATFSPMLGQFWAVSRYNIGPIWAVNSCLSLLGQFRPLHLPSAGPTVQIDRPSTETWPSIGDVPTD